MVQPSTFAGLGPQGFAILFPQSGGAMFGTASRTSIPRISFPIPRIRIPPIPVGPTITTIRAAHHQIEHQNRRRRLTHGLRLDQTAQYFHPQSLQCWRICSTASNLAPHFGHFGLRARRTKTVGGICLTGHA